MACTAANIRSKHEPVRRGVENGSQSFRYSPNASETAASGAEKYTVYLFDQYPDYGVDPIWPVNQTQTNDARMRVIGSSS